MNYPTHPSSDTLHLESQKRAEEFEPKGFPPLEISCVCAHVYVGVAGVRFKSSMFSNEFMCLKGLRTTGLADSPRSTEEADPDRESGLFKVPQQIRVGLGPCPGPFGCGMGQMKRLHPHSPSLPQALLLTQHGVLSGHSPVWAARPGAGRSEELPGFAEVAGIDLALVAGLGRQGEHMG